MRGVPGLGEHTADVISTLGLSDEQVRVQLPYAAVFSLDGSSVAAARADPAIRCGHAQVKEILASSVKRTKAKL
jgi:hypothetical protein